jgi:hypothetical protein
MDSRVQDGAQKNEFFHRGANSLLQTWPGQPPGGAAALFSKTIFIGTIWLDLPGFGTIWLDSEVWLIRVWEPS